MPFEIPESWEWVRLDDVAQSNIGLTYSPSEITNDGIPVLRSCNIKNQKLYWEDLVRVNSNILEKQYLNDGDLLICARNGSRHLVGKCALITNIQEPISFGAFMAVCRSQFNRWIYYLLHTTYFDRYLDDSNSTTINQVTQKMLLDFQIPLPPAVEQQRIVAEVEKWFALIDELEANKEDLKEYIKQVKSKVLDLAIHGKLVPQDPNDEPAIELLKRINPNFKPCDTSHYENLPAGWSITALSHIIDLFDSKRKPIKAEERARRIEGKDVLYPYYGATGLVGYIDDYLIEGKFLLLGEDGAPFLDQYAEKAYAVEGKIWVNNHAHLVRPKIDFDYLKIYLNAFNYHDVAKGTTRLKLTQGDMNSILVTIPPLKEQRRISSFVENVFSLIDTISTEL